MRLAKTWPTRLALKLEAHLGQFTILSNVSRHAASTTLVTQELKAEGLSQEGTRSTSCREHFQETSSTQWQKN
jgi:hypothetical protein